MHYAGQGQGQLLEERVNLDSNNSSKPPSSNGPGQMNRTQRRASERRRGAQPGHKGHTRALLDEREVDRLVDCKPEAVCEVRVHAASVRMKSMTCNGNFISIRRSPPRREVYPVNTYPY